MSNQEYTLLFEDRGDYLYARLEGQDSFAASLSYWNEIADRIGKLGLKKLLVHENLVGEISKAEMFELMGDIVPAAKGIQIAFYDAKQISAKMNKFGQLVAENRGANVRIFETLEEAQHWIEREV